jgi:hypothetical protein
MNTSPVQSVPSLKKQYEKVSSITDDQRAFLAASFRISKVNNAIADLQDSVSNGDMTGYEANERLIELLGHMNDIRTELEVTQ